jgi:fibronectin type 3 domain-containing protein
LNSAAIQATTSIDTTVQSGNTYYYAITALDAAGDESGYSNQATAVIP